MLQQRLNSQFSKSVGTNNVLKFELIASNDINWTSDDAIDVSLNYCNTTVFVEDSTFVNHKVGYC